MCPLGPNLHPHSLWRLRALLRAHERQLRLLETVPGIDRRISCATQVKLGPHLSACRKLS